ncbi:MAG: hypothetical protein CM1200mP2_44870 [Planctomycetaceae bacterium]|nr:MAG: hypothetical protein CM1200mP2_44870 [Planctomycetaceae bacterium]
MENRFGDRLGQALRFSQGPHSLVCRGQGGSERHQAGRVKYRFTYEADTKAKPAEFRVYNGERLLMSGIYRYQGKLLQLCFVRGEKTEPPENFTARGIGHQLYVLEPVKTP